MTLEERLNELEDAIQKLRNDIQATKRLKFKVGDTVLIVGVVQQVDAGDTELPYKVAIVDDDNLQWYRESDLQPKE